MEARLQLSSRPLFSPPSTVSLSVSSHHAAALPFASRVASSRLVLALLSRPACRAARSSRPAPSPGECGNGGLRGQPRGRVLRRPARGTGHAGPACRRRGPLRRADAGAAHLGGVWVHKLSGRPCSQSTPLQRQACPPARQQSARSPGRQRRARARAANARRWRCCSAWRGPRWRPSTASSRRR